MHLTNYSVNRKSGQFEHNTAASNDGEGSKWSLTAFWRCARSVRSDAPCAAHAQADASMPRRPRYMAERGADVDLLQKQIREIAVKTLVSVEHSVVSKCNQVPRVSPSPLSPPCGPPAEPAKPCPHNHLKPLPWMSACFF